MLNLCLPFLQSSDIVFDANSQSLHPLLPERHIFRSALPDAIKLI
jgi:hypothetical protein